MKLTSLLEEHTALKQLFWETGDIHKFYLYYFGFYDVYQNKYFYFYMAWVNILIKSKMNNANSFNFRFN